MGQTPGWAAISCRGSHSAHSRQRNNAQVPQGVHVRTHPRYSFRILKAILEKRAVLMGAGDSLRSAFEEYYATANRIKDYMEEVQKSSRIWQSGCGVFVPSRPLRFGWSLVTPDSHLCCACATGLGVMLARELACRSLQHSCARVAWGGA